MTKKSKIEALIIAKLAGRDIAKEANNHTDYMYLSRRITKLRAKLLEIIKEEIKRRYQ